MRQFKLFDERFGSIFDLDPNWINLALNVGALRGYQGVPTAFDDSS